MQLVRRKRLSFSVFRIPRFQLRFLGITRQAIQEECKNPLFPPVFLYLCASVVHSNPALGGRVAIFHYLFVDKRLITS